ncbi:hypothetical protein VCUG_00100, partial [Vavraia culicis subsp. floridensis]
MFKILTIEKSSYIIDTLYIGEILVAATSNAVYFYDKHDKLVHVLKICHINKVKWEKERFFVLSGKTKLHVHEILNYKDIVTDNKSENFKVRKAGCTDIKEYGGILLSYEIANIHSIYYLNVSDTFIVLTSLCGTCYILERDSLRYVGRYHFLAIPLELKTRQDWLFVLSKQHTKYYFTKYKIGVSVKNALVPEEYVVPVDRYSHVLIEKDYSFELDKCHSFVITKERLIFLSSDKIVLYHGFIKLFVLEVKISPDCYLVIGNTVLIVDCNDREHIIEVTSNKVIHEYDSAFTEQYKQQYDSLRRCTRARTFNPIKGSIIHLGSNEIIQYRYFDTVYREFDVKCEQNETTKTFSGPIKNYFVYEPYIFVVANKIEFFDVEMLKKMVHTGLDGARTNLVASQVGQYLKNTFFDLKTLVDIIVVKKSVIMIFQTFLILKEEKYDVVYTAYHINSKYLVFSNKNTVKLLRLKLIESVSLDRTADIFKCYTFNFVIFDVLVYKRTFILLTGDRTIRIYDFKKRSFVFIQFFLCNVSTVFLIKNFLFVVSKHILKTRISKNYEITDQKTIGGNYEFVSKKRYNSKHSEKMLLCIKQNEHYKHFLVTKRKIYEMSKDELYVSAYSVKFSDNKMNFYERKQHYRLKSTHTVDKTAPIGTSSMIFVGDIMIFNHVDGTYRVRFGESNEKQHDGYLKAAANFNNCLLALVWRMDRCFLDIIEEKGVDSIQLSRDYDLITACDDKILLVKHEKIFLYDFMDKSSKKRKKYEIRANGGVYITAPSPILKIIGRNRYVYLITKKDALMIFYKTKLKYSIFETQYLINFEVLKDDLIITSDKIGKIRLYRIVDDIKLMFVRDIRDILVSAVLVGDIIYYLTGNGTKGMIQIRYKARN